MYFTSIQSAQDDFASFTQSTNLDSDSCGSSTMDDNLRISMDSRRPCTTSDLDERKRRHEERVRPWASTEHIEMGRMLGRFFFFRLFVTIAPDCRSDYISNLLHFIATEMEITCVHTFVALC